MAPKKFLFLFFLSTIAHTKTIYTSQASTESPSASSKSPDPRPIPTLIICAWSSLNAQPNYIDKQQMVTSPSSRISRSHSLATIPSDNEDMDYDEDDDKQASQLLGLSLSQLLLFNELPGYQATQQFTHAELPKTPKPCSPNAQTAPSITCYHAPLHSRTVVRYVGRFTVTDSATPSPAPTPTPTPTPRSNQAQNVSQSTQIHSCTSQKGYSPLRTCASEARLEMTRQTTGIVSTGPIRKSTWPSNN